MMVPYTPCSCTATCCACHGIVRETYMSQNPAVLIVYETRSDSVDALDLKVRNGREARIPLPILRRANDGNVRSPRGARFLSVGANRR